MNTELKTTLLEKMDELKTDVSETLEDYEGDDIQMLDDLITVVIHFRLQEIQALITGKNK